MSARGAEVPPADGTELLAPGLVSLVRAGLELHPHFRGRASLLAIGLVDQTIVLSGLLPSYYLKQLLQEAIRGVPGVVEIDNHVLVMRPEA